MFTESPAPPPDPIAVVYGRLRDLAARRLAEERPGHTLQATAPVHDVYLRLAGEDPARWADTAHFFHAAAEAMRRVLVDHARGRGRAKRGGGGRRVPLTEAVDVATLAGSADPADVLALDAAVTRLDSFSPEAAAVIRPRFHARLSVEQVAAVLGTSARSVARKWTYARAKLRRKLAADATPG